VRTLSGTSLAATQPASGRIALETGRQALPNTTVGGVRMVSLRQELQLFRDRRYFCGDFLAHIWQLVVLQKMVACNLVDVRVRDDPPHRQLDSTRILLKGGQDNLSVASKGGMPRRHWF
jgi:hypothetical protein